MSDEQINNLNEINVLNFSIIELLAQKRKDK